MQSEAKAKAKAKVVVEDTHGLLCETFDIQGRLQRNPYAMVIGAVGVGFVLGGGLFTRLTERILGAGLRACLMAALPILQKEFVGANSPEDQAPTGSKLNQKKEKDQ